MSREAGQGKRNGYVPGHLDTAEGRVSVHVPQVREAGEPYRSATSECPRKNA
jgi:transposase-like protein